MDKENEETETFDKIDRARFYMYTINYNVLRIMSGMSGLAFQY